MRVLVFNFINCNTEELTAISELQQLLGFTISENGRTVCIEHITVGFAVVKDSNSIKIQYSRKETLFRSILILTANIDKESFNVKETNSFEDLGLLVDMSRNAVLRLETVKDLVRHMAVLGYNSLQLYTEDTFEVKDEPYFGYMRGRLTGEEIKEIDSYCKLFGIELIPCIQCLAHINQITRYANYDPIVDVNDILLVNEKSTYDFLENIFKSVSVNFSSKKINIGMDEAHMLGLGKYLDKHGYQKRFDIMIQHLEKVRALCKKYGLEPRMWSDMFFRLIYGGEYYKEDTDFSPELLEKIPKDVMLLYWDYYSFDYNRYDSMLKKHLKISENVGFAGGAWKWTGFAPDNAYSIGTVKSSLKACSDNKIKSFLLTCWGDNGAEASIFSILPSIYYCAENAYTGSFEKDKFKALTGISFDDFMKVDLPNRIVQSDYERNNASKFFLYNDILIGTFDSLAFDGISNIYEKHAQELKSVCVKAGRYSYMFNILQKLCEVLAVKAEIGVNIKKAYDNKDSAYLKQMVEFTLPTLIDRLKSFYREFNFQWHKENKAFGFEVQCIRLGGLITRVEYVKERLSSYIQGEIPVIEELEQERMPFNYFSNLDLDRLIYNLWNVITSPSVI